jgi:cell division protein FtsB
MEILPIDLTSLVATTLGILIVLIPVFGLTVRFAIKPVAEALGRARDAAVPSRELEVITARLRELEEEIIRLKNTDPYRTSLPAGSDPLRSGQGRG